MPITPNVHSDKDQDLYTLPAVASLTGAKMLREGKHPAMPIAHYVYDTRLGSPQGNALFLALSGKLHDGHRYLSEAYRLGIRNFLLKNLPDVPLPDDAGILIHDNPLDVLQTLAAFHRSKFNNLVVIGITGSNGKTMVKEWMASLAEGRIPFIKSPRSYNSQLGVALSLLQIRSEHRVAIIEAGISQKGEMAKLAGMIRPNIGIFTHLGDAHAEGFASVNEKLHEKCLLFKNAETVIAPSNTTHEQDLKNILGAKLNTVGVNGSRWEVTGITSNALEMIDLKTRRSVVFDPPFTDDVSLQNTFTAIAGIAEIGIDISPEQIHRLQPVSMRLEIIDDNPEVTILNDAYNADRDSVVHAIQMLERMKKHANYFLFLTDLEHQGTEQENVQKELLTYAISKLGTENIITIGSIFQKLHPHFPKVKTFPSVEDCIMETAGINFKNVNVLLKGARKYRLERLIPVINQKANATYLKINLNALKHNFLVLKDKIPTDFKTIAMIKAAAYGSGAWQIARELSDCGADYFAVAFTGEGIDLRKQGIEQPVLILNPDEATLEPLLQYRLEPAVGTFRVAEKLKKIADEIFDTSLDWGFHIEFDTGMGRLGFSIQDTEAIIYFLKKNRLIHRVKSVFTHLSSADDPLADDFTLNQLRLFTQTVTRFRAETLHPDFFTHALNTAGILRFSALMKEPVDPHPQGVRMGIGLYGIDPTGLFPELVEVGSLHTVISQIHEYPAGTPVGYGGSAITARLTRVATLPVGYADGFPRRLGNGKYAVKVRGQHCPIIGRVCMDMLMIDVTDVPDTLEEDEVHLFGNELPVTRLANAADTIPYEILVGISGRVRRIYVKE